MYKKIHPLLQKPALYERTSEKFWNDEHISKEMLKFHLDPDIDAASRKHEFIDCSVQWILSLLPNGARLLDIGCGPGLYTKRFAENGLVVTGLDISENSLHYAKEHDQKSEYVLMNYLEMDYHDTFDMITLIWCDYGALIPEERANLMKWVVRALKPGGLFLFDVFTPAFHKRLSENTSWELHEQGGFWSAKPHLCLNAEYVYNETANVSRTVVVDDEGKVHCYNIWNTSFTRESILDEAQPAGLITVGFYSDVAGKLYQNESETMCVLLQKQEEPSVREKF